MKFLVPAILLGVLADVYFRFIRFFFPGTELPSRISPLWIGALPISVTVAAFSALFWLFFVLWRSADSHLSKREAWLEKAGHLAIGYASFLIVGLFLRDLLIRVSPAPTAQWLRTPGANFFLFLVVWSAVCAGFITARRGPVVRETRLSVDFPFAGNSPLRIVQISDLHVGSWIGRTYVEKVSAKIRALGQIDLLLLTGDIGDGDPALHAHALSTLGLCPARLGKFSVSGNHEGYWDVTAWNSVIRGLGFEILENRGVDIPRRGELPPIRISGIADANPRLPDALRELSPDALNLFLAHQPKYADAAAAFRSATGGRVHLQLSGHTHNGQFFPWNLLIGFFQKYPRGLYTVAAMKLYVNIGTGFWGAPLRLGTRSEITLLEVSSSA